MTEDHEAIEELLAGYVLRSLSGDDAAEADRLLSTHVPRCSSCRTTLEAFHAVTGELALAVPSVAPPELLTRRIRHEIEDTPVRGRRRIAMWVSVAAMIALIAVAGWSVVLDGQLSSAKLRSASLDSFLKAVPAGSKMLSLGDGAAKIAFAYTPGRPFTRMIALDVPPPGVGNIYRVWLHSNVSGKFIAAGQFIPPAGGGLFQIDLPFDLLQYDQVLITEEPSDSIPSEPTMTVRYGPASV